MSQSANRNDAALDHARAALTETDRRVSIAPAMGAEDRFVAVHEKAADLARAQGEGTTAVEALLAEAAPAGFGRAGDRAGAEEVARQEVAAAARVMRHQLRQRPVEVGRIAVGDP